MRDSVKPGALVGERLGQYDLLALLAVGGTAEIYLARIGGEAGFEKYVVVKCLLDHLAEDAEFVRMFLDEARLGAQLDHSNIVHTLGLGEQRNRYYLVMEYLAGMSLAQLARKVQERTHGGLIPIEIVLSLAAQTCSGLAYAHKRSAQDGTDLNLVHRDISPQNLVVSFDGVLKIVDFGIAKADVRETNTRSGTIKGKFAYMSPEQCLGKGIDRRTDIFALGTIIHELLTGRRLFKRSTTYETYQAIINGQVVKPSQVNPDLSDEVDELILRALSYQREDRYPDAEAFGEALLNYLHKIGKSVNSGDIAEYIEVYFGPELEEHAHRMRELISGRSTAVTELWDSDEVGGDVSGGAVDPRAETITPDDLPSVSVSISEQSNLAMDPTEVGNTPPHGRYAVSKDDIPSDRVEIRAPLPTDGDRLQDVVKVRDSASGDAVDEESGVTAIQSISGRARQKKLTPRPPVIGGTPIGEASPGASVDPIFPGGAVARIGPDRPTRPILDSVSPPGDVADAIDDDDRDPLLDTVEDSIEDRAATVVEESVRFAPEMTPPGPTPTPTAPSASQGPTPTPTAPSASQGPTPTPAAPHAFGGALSAGPPAGQPAGQPAPMPMTGMPAGGMPPGGMPRGGMPPGGGGFAPMPGAAPGTPQPIVHAPTPTPTPNPNAGAPQGMFPGYGPGPGYPGPPPSATPELLETLHNDLSAGQLAAIEHHGAALTPVPAPHPAPRGRAPFWALALSFFVAVAIGLSLTVLVGRIWL